METIDSLSKQLTAAKSIKQVHFAPDIPTAREVQAEFTPYKKAKKETNYARLKKNVIGLLANGSHEELRSYLKSYTSNEIEEFFSQYGSRIFNSALLYAQTSDQLSFLLKNTSREHVLQILYKDNFGIIMSYIDIKNSIAQERTLTSSELELFSNQISLLLELKDENIHHAVKTIISKQDINENIKTIVNELLLKFNDNGLTSLHEHRF